MEEMRRSLDQSRLRCLILEADKDAEMAAKHAEKLRASRYRSILAELAGEGDIRAKAAVHPQASGLHLMPWDGSVHSTSRALTSYFARNRLTVIEPQAQPAATISTELQTNIEVSSPPISIATCTPPPNSRNLNSASHGEPESNQNTVRTRSSRSTQQTTRPLHVSTMTDGQRSSEQRNARVPSASTSRRGTIVSINGTPLAEMCARAGVSPFELTRGEQVHANKARGILWSTFTKKFGSHHHRSEWPKCDRIPGYKFLCVDTTAQPFVPTAPGKPGFLLTLPTMGLPPQDDGHTFHVFSMHHNLLHYQGEYTRPRLLRVEFDDWNHLPHVCKDVWLRRLSGNHAANTVVFRTLRARIILRNKFKREPQSSEVLGYLMSDQDNALPYKVVSAAFRAGEEKLIVEALQCISYDSNLATIIRRDA